MNGKILVPEWLKRENPICAGFCEMINEALQNRPYLSLAEFAEQIDMANKESTYKRLQEVVTRQIEDILRGLK
jgi:hypothetical protein